MAQPRCVACHTPIDGPRAMVTFDGFSTLALNGVTMQLHAKCLRLEFPEAPPIDPVTETLFDALVNVEWDDLGWTATCSEHGNVALKNTEDDAHLVAAYHLARVHSGLAS